MAPATPSRATSPSRLTPRKKVPAPTLFPSIPKPNDPSPPGPATLVGIARLAASSPLAEEKRGTEYFLLPVRSILNRCTSERVPFEWTVNPYRGCEFGCRYCYARYTHEYMELAATEFEHKIYAKKDASALVARDLTEHAAALAGGGRPQHIAIGTATDPYQPAERDFGVTRAILERLAEREGLSISITTKSNQVSRDIDVLQRIAARSQVTVNITVTTLRPRLARLLEPRAPRPDLRLAAVRQLREAGLSAGVFSMPVLPGLTDRETDLDAVARAARDAGAQWYAGQVLFLMPASQKAFFPFLEEKLPKLARRYREFYAKGAYAPESYRKEIGALFRRLRAKYGLGVRPYAPDAVAQSLARNTLQMSLPLDAAPALSPDASRKKEPERQFVAAPRPKPAVRQTAMRSCACA
jgi:DNA repair photolyase